MTAHKSHFASLASRALIALTVSLAIVAVVATRASALPGALSVKIVESVCNTDTVEAFADELRAVPGVQTVSHVSAGAVADGGSGTTPTAASLEGIDAVIAVNDCVWADSTQLGNVLADYADRGGVVIAPNWNFWTESQDAGYALLGRWASGGYSPITQTQTGDDQPVTLGSHDSSHPFFTGVSSLTNSSAYPGGLLAPGATPIANWDNGWLAVAIKGQALAYNGWMVDVNGSNGLDSTFIVNAVNQLAPRTVSVGIAGNGKGVVNGGSCTNPAVCTLRGIPGKALPVQAVELSGSVFTGWTGACTGNAAICQLTVGYPGITATLWNTPALTANFALTKLKIGKYKKHKLSLTLPGAGKLVVKGSGVKTINKVTKQSGTIKLAFKTTGKVKKKLKSGKSAKVKLKLTYTPTGAATGTIFKKTVTLQP